MAHEFTGQQLPHGGSVRPSMDVRFLDKAALRAWMHSETRLEISDDAVAAAQHSIYCVMRRHMDAAKRAAKAEVAKQVAQGEFEDLPPLRGPLQHALYCLSELASEDLLEPL